jgi:hypothetical protein
MSHGNPSSKNTRKSALLLVVVGLSVLSAATLNGQGPFAAASGTMDLILTKLDAILAAVAAPPSPQPSEITLATGELLLGASVLTRCTVTNMSDRRFAVTATGTAFPVDLPPRSTIAVVNNFQLYGGCTFTFTGFANEIRASMVVYDQSGIPSVVLEAR